jgi:predicted Zn-dependent protease
MQPISSRIAAPRRVAALALAGAGLLWLPACATLTIPEERELGKQASGQIAREVRFVRDRAIRSYVSGLGAEILEAAGPQPFDYHFYVIEDDDINAFAAPAGYIYVHTETILRARNVSELTGVLAHEVGHVVKRHIARNYNRQRWTGIFSQFFGVLFSFFIGGYAANAAQMGTELAAIAYINSFGREAEEEADAFAVEVMPVAR